MPKWPKSDRRWEKSFNTSTELSVGRGFTAGKALEGVFKVIFPSSDPALDWKVIVRFQRVEDAENRFMVDVDLLPLTCTYPKRNVFLMASGSISICCRVVCDDTHSPYNCPFSSSSQVQPVVTGYGLFPPLNQRPVPQVAAPVRREWPLSESFAFRVKDVPIQTAVPTAYNHRDEMLIRLSITHYSEQKIQQHVDVGSPAVESGLMPKIVPKLQSLLDSGRMSDVTFEVGNDAEAVLAHSQVLAAASDVFEAMFTANTRDKKTRRVKVPDADFVCFKEMLRCIYAGCEPAWSGEDGKYSTQEEEDLLFGLLYLSEKYNLDDLKEYCKKRTLATMTVENAIARLKDLDVIQPRLIPMVIRSFVKFELHDIISQEAWKDVLQQNLKLAATIMHESIKQL